MNKKLNTILVFVLIAITAGLSGAMVYINSINQGGISTNQSIQKKSEELKATSDSSSYQESHSIKSQNATSRIDIKDWKTYINIQYKYEIKYPKSWWIYNSDASDIFLQPSKEQTSSIPSHGDALEIYVTKVDANLSLSDDVKNIFGQAGISYKQQDYKIDQSSGLKVISICDGLGCGNPEWFVLKKGYLYHFKSNLGYSVIFDAILSTFHFVD